jgi:ABC-type uncharacterized transport system auxiliary subunit
MTPSPASQLAPAPAKKTISLTLQLTLITLLLAGLLTSCGFSRPYPAIRSFNLEDPILAGDPVQTTARPAKVRRPLLIQVTSGGASPQYETRKLVHKIGPNEFTEDFYNELVGLPSRLIVDQLASFLDEHCQHFRATQGVTSQSPDLTLDIYLTAFHGDYSQKPPRATVELKVNLTDQRGSRARTLMSKSYSGSRDLPGDQSDGPRALTVALSQAISPIMADIAADIEANFGSAKSSRR